jgi:hypothetical protein
VPVDGSCCMIAFLLGYRGWLWLYGLRAARGWLGWGQVLVSSLCTGEQLVPVVHVRAVAQQGASLTFSHAAPHAELVMAIEGLGQAFGTDWAALADPLRPLLLMTQGEHLLRIVTAPAQRGHLGAHHQRLASHRDRPPAGW